VCIWTSNCCRNDSLHRCAKINTVWSTSRLQHIVCSSAGCVLSLWVQSFVLKAVLSKFILWHRMKTRCMWLCLKPWHQIKSLQNKKWCTCTAHQLRILVSFDDCYFSEVLHSTLHRLECGIMLCLAKTNNNNFYFLVLTQVHLPIQT